MAIIQPNTPLIEVATGDYPIFLSEAALRIKNIAFGTETGPETLYEFGYEVVNLVEAPEGDVVTEGKPELIDKEWYQHWEVRQFTPEELATNLESAKQIRYDQIEKFRKANFEKGFPYEFGAETYHVQIRDGDRQNISSIRVVAKEAIQEERELTLGYRVYENVTVQLTAAEFVALADTAFVRVNEGYRKTWDLKDAVKDATVIADIPDLPEELFESAKTFNR